MKSKDTGVGAGKRKASYLPIASLGFALLGCTLFFLLFLAFELNHLFSVLPIFAVLSWILSLLTGIIALLRIKQQSTWPKGKKRAIAGILISIIFLGVCVYVYSVTGPPKVVTKVSMYHKIKNELWHNPTLIKHFPETLPSDSNNTHLSFFPGFLQGAAWFQLKLCVPEEEINVLLAEFDSKKKVAYGGGGTWDHKRRGDNALPATSYLLGRSKDNGWPEFLDWPDDFTIIVLDAQDYLGGENPSWNHGYSYGVSISEKRKEIVYWVEDW